MKHKEILVAVLTMLTAASCSNSKSGSSQTQVETIDVSDFTGNNALSATRSIDSMALQADFLTSQEGVSVLVGLSEIAKSKQGNERLEYMRKYLDTYDILTSRGDEFAQAIASSKSSTGIDLQSIFNQYRDTLNEEDDGTTFEDDDQPTTTVPETPSEPKEEETEQPVPADSVQ